MTMFCHAFVFLNAFGKACLFVEEEGENTIDIGHQHVIYELSVLITTLGTI